MKNLFFVALFLLTSCTTPPSSSKSSHHPKPPLVLENPAVLWGAPPEGYMVGIGEGATKEESEQNSLRNLALKILSHVETRGITVVKTKTDRLVKTSNGKKVTIGQWTKKKLTQRMVKVWTNISLPGLEKLDTKTKKAFFYTRALVNKEKYRLWFQKKGEIQTNLHLARTHLDKAKKLKGQGKTASFIMEIGLAFRLAKDAYLRYLLVVGAGDKAQYDFKILQSADALAFSAAKNIRIYVDIRETWEKKKPEQPIFSSMVKEELAKEGMAVEISSNVPSGVLPIFIKGRINTFFVEIDPDLGYPVYKTSDALQIQCSGKTLLATTAGASRGRAKGIARSAYRAQERALRERAKQFIKKAKKSLYQFFPYLGRGLKQEK